MSDYICGERFAALAGQKTEGGATIAYAPTHKVADVLATIAGRPAERFVLLTHNSDHALTREQFEARPANVVAWWSQNATPAAVAAGARALPIGVVNSHVARGCPVTLGQAADACRCENPELLVGPWSDHTHALRPKLRASLAGKPRVRFVADWLDFADYCREVSQARYVLSPPGAGHDCHRRYEAQYLGAIPVVCDYDDCPAIGGAVVLANALAWASGPDPVAALDDMPATTYHAKALRWGDWHWCITGRATATPRALLAFSLWGGAAKYCHGAIENAKLAKTIYPDYEMHVWWKAGVPGSVVSALRDLGVVDHFMGRHNERGPRGAAFWRFHAAAAYDADVVLFRDADSRINWRERAAVDEWLATGAPLHCMHDHEHHRIFPILAGMWGVRGGALRDIHQRIAGWTDFESHDCDQRFLRDCVWPDFTAPDAHLRHSSHVVKWPFQPFPTHRKPAGCAFVGEVVEVHAPDIMPTGGKCHHCAGAGCAKCKWGGMAADLEPGDQTFAQKVEGMRAAEFEAITAIVGDWHGQSAISCGANDGVLGDPVGRAYQAGASVVFVEPDPRAAWNCWRNYSAKDRTRVVCAAWAPSGRTVELHPCASNDRLSTTSEARVQVSPARKDMAGHPLTVATLDWRELWALADTPPAFVNIDVEGFNGRCLGDLLSVPNRRPACICVEHQGEDEARILATAKAEGYREAYRTRENIVLEREP